MSFFSDGGLWFSFTRKKKIALTFSPSARPGFSGFPNGLKKILKKYSHSHSSLQQKILWHVKLLRRKIAGHFLMMLQNNKTNTFLLQRYSFFLIFILLWSSTINQQPIASSSWVLRLAADAMQRLRAPHACWVEKQQRQEHHVRLKSLNKKWLLSKQLTKRRHSR